MDDASNFEFDKHERCVRAVYIKKNEYENIYSALKEEYTRYRTTLRHSIREAKEMYYTRTFNIYTRMT